MNKKLSKTPPGREMYYNTSNNSNTSNTSEYQSIDFTKDEMPTDIVRDTEASPHPLSPLREDIESQEESGNAIAEPDPIAWICAQWCWSKTRARRADQKATRLRVTATIHYATDMGTQNPPKRITFNLTDRLREFQPANPFQQHVRTLAGLQDQRWIGKARIRQPKHFDGDLPDQYRRNIPDLVMTAQIESDCIQATLYTMDQTIELRFDQPLSAAQQKIYEGEARWGERIRRRPVDDFYDWKKYA